jgi:hypothetical protein
MKYRRNIGFWVLIYRYRYSQIKISISIPISIYRTGLWHSVSHPMAKTAKCANSWTIKLVTSTQRIHVCFSGIKFDPIILQPHQPKDMREKVVGRIWLFGGLVKRSHSKRRKRSALWRRGRRSSISNQNIYESKYCFRLESHFSINCKWVYASSFIGIDDINVP